MTKHRIPGYQPMQSGTVKMTKIVPLTGGVLFLGFSAIAMVAALQEAWKAVVIFGVLDVFALAMLLTVNWQICFTPEGFTHRNFLRISRSYTYDQITAIRRGDDCLIEIGKRRILVDEMAEYGSEFINMAAEKAHHAKYTMPEGSAADWIFRGHVRYPLLIAAPVGLLTIMMCCVMARVLEPFEELTLVQMEMTETVISDYVEQPDDACLKLLRNDASGYVLYDYDTDLSEFQKLTEVVDAGKKLRIYYEVVTIDAEDVQEQRVAELRCGDVVYYSIDSYNAYRHKNWLSFTVFCVGFMAIWFIILAVSWFILRHADEYPKLARMIIKDGYLQ